MKNNNIKVITKNGITTTPEGWLEIQKIQQSKKLDCWTTNIYFWVALNHPEVKSHYWLFENGRLNVFHGDFEVSIKDGETTRTYAGERGMQVLRNICLPVVENW